MTQHNENERLDGVQYLRAIAALQVVLFHASTVAGHRIALGGFGVPLFFVISGFIMVVITGPDSRPASFLRNRAARIVPLYWAATSVAALVALEGGRLSLRHLAASYLFLPWPRIGAERHFFPVLGVGWTLNYEAFFYALFALSLLAPARLRLAVLTSLFTSFAALGFLIDSDIGAARFYTQPLILQFLAGAWIGHVWKHRTSLAWPLLGCAFAVVLLAIPALLHFREAIWRGLWAVLTLLAVLAAHRSFPTRRRFAFGLLLGDASYSLYLWHPLVLLALAAAGPPGWVFLAVGIPLSIAAGLLSYRFFERPLLRYFRRQRRKHEGVAPSA